jgi:hypothetical protein
MQLRLHFFVPEIAIKMLSLHIQLLIFHAAVSEYSF